MDNIVWPALLEKAFAKVKGSYAAANGGFVETGIRSLTGAPVFTYWADELTDDELFSSMKEANELDYIMGAGTYGTDTATNECGVVAGHAYTIMEAFELLDTDGTTVAGELYMVRNPWGSTTKTDGLWGQGECTSDSFTDEFGDGCDWYASGYGCGDYDTSTASAFDACCGCGGGTTAANEAWTADFIAQVPHDIDPLTSASEDGVFFLDKSEILSCFDDFNIAHYRNGEGYTDNWMEMYWDSSDWGDYEEYTITTADDQTGDLYFTVETYYLGQISYMC